MNIDQLVKTSLEAEIIKAFKEAPEAIDALVSACLQGEVDEYGGKANYNSRERMPYLTWLARDTVRNIARDAVKQHLAEITPRIQEQVKAALATEAIVDAFTREIIKATADEWRIDVQFKSEK
jgi:hypothetical protein